MPSRSDPSFSKDFEYLIRRELDAEHAPGTLQRNGRRSILLFSVVKFSSRFYSERLSESHSSTDTIETETQKVSERSSRVFAKAVLLSLSSLNRSIPRLPLAIPLNKSSANLPPFALTDPFELNSSSAGAGLLSVPSSARSQRDPADLLRFNPSSYALAMGTPGANPYQKLNLSSSLYNQFSIHQEHISSANQRSFSCNYTPYSSSSASMKLTLPTPVLPLSAPTTVGHDHPGHVSVSSSRKTKVNIGGRIEQSTW